LLLTQYGNRQLAAGILAFRQSAVRSLEKCLEVAGWMFTSWMLLQLPINSMETEAST